MDPVKLDIDGEIYTVTEQGLSDEEGNIVFEYNEHGDAVDVDGDVIVEGAHDMMNAEVQSVQSVSKAAKSTKQAPKRGSADKRGTGETAPKSVAGKIGAMYDKMKGLSKEDLDVAYDKVMGENFTAAADELIDEEDVLEDVSYDFSEDLDALVESEATLSEEFKEKTAVIFEAAIKSKVREEIDRLEAEYEQQIDEETQQIHESLVDQVDSYLNYAVETWMTENEVAIENGLRAEIAENFMKGFFDLCTENYIEVPESKVDLVDELADQVEGLEEQLSTSVESMINMSEELEFYKRCDIVREHAGDLADTQAEKLFGLVEDIDFEDEESFAEKVKTVKESYFGKKAVEGDNTVAEEQTSADGEADEIIESSPMMESYVSAIRKTTK